MPRAPRPRSARYHRLWSRCSAATGRRSRRSPASTSGRSAPCRKPSRACRSSSPRSRPTRAAGRASWSPRSARTATTAEAARQAVENDVHVLGVSSLAGAHLTLVPELKAALVQEGRDDIMIVVGGVVPPQDYEELERAGAEAIFPPGTVIAEAAAE